MDKRKGSVCEDEFVDCVDDLSKLDLEKVNKATVDKSSFKKEILCINNEAESPMSSTSSRHDVNIEKRSEDKSGEFFNGQEGDDNDPSCAVKRDEAENSLEDNNTESLNQFNDSSSSVDNHQEPSEESDDESQLTESEIKDRTCEAKKLKEAGNLEYKNEKFDDAVGLYSDGIKICPKCSKKDRAVLFSNRSACYVKLDCIDDAIDDCSAAVSLHPQYLKAYMRRAQLYDKTEKFEEAAKDYEKVLELDKSIHAARQALMEIPGKIEERNEKLKQQMMSSLKDLGNLFLRPFGLSTDNFQMQQDPNSGSYNVQFNNASSNGPPNGK